MSPEERTRIYGDTGQSRVMNFMDAIEKDGYMVEASSFAKFREMTELVADGNTAPIKSFEDLKNIEKNLVNMEDHTSVFRYIVRDSLNNVSKIVKNDRRYIDEASKYNKLSEKEKQEANLTEIADIKTFDSLLSNVKHQLGIIQAHDRIAEAKASRAKTKAQIDALDLDTTMSIEKKNRALRELLNTYNGANEAAIKNAESIAARQEIKFNKSFNKNNLDDVNKSLKELYDYVMLLNLEPNNKKILIDEFNNILKARNEILQIFHTNNKTKEAYNKKLAELGLVKKNIKAKEKTVEAKPTIEEPIVEETIVIEEPIVVKEEATIEIDPSTKSEENSPKPGMNLEDEIKLEEELKEQGIDTPIKIDTEYVHLKRESKYHGDISGIVLDQLYAIVPEKDDKQIIIDGVVHYKLEGMGERLFSSLDFTVPTKDVEISQELENEEPKVEKQSKLKKVLGIKPRKSIGKASIIARGVAVTAVATNLGLATLIGPALLALIPIWAAAEYKNYSKFEKSRGKQPILNRMLTKVTDKLKSMKINGDITPENSVELENIINKANAIEKESSEELVKEEPVKAEEVIVNEEPTINQDTFEETGDLIFDKGLQDALNMTSQGLSKEEAIDKALEGMANLPAGDNLEMGGR